MKYTVNIFGIVIACASGYLGGVLGSQHNAEASSPGPIRASRFELVNSAGSTVATWSVDPDSSVHLRMLHGREPGTDIGILADGRPFFRMGGRDGKNRIAMVVDQSDKPMLVMSDARWEGRVHLGFIEPDTMPDPDWDSWGLSFRAFGSERPIAGIGMMKTSAGQVEGLLTVSGKRIR